MTEQQDLRRDAMYLLKDYAFGVDPFLTMQAIEAFQVIGEEEGVPYVADNAVPTTAGGVSSVTFAALMALGAMGQCSFLDKFRQCAEDPDPNVRIASLFALHRCGHPSRTGELGDTLLNHPTARVRANAAMALGRLGERNAIKPLSLAYRRERKTAVKGQILEALALCGDPAAADRLVFEAYSAVPGQSVVALAYLANAGSERAEDVFVNRLHRGERPEVRLQAARGLGRLGRDDGLELALAYLFYNAPLRGEPDDPPEQQTARVRSLAALAVEAIGNPDALGPLRDAFDARSQSPLVRIACARAAIRIMDLAQGRPRRNDPAKPPATARSTVAPGT